MAYTALRSLSQALGQILNHYDQYPLHHQKETLVSLQEKVTTMLSLLKDNPVSKAIHLMETRVIDAAYQAEDTLESQFSDINLPRSRLRDRVESCISICQPQYKSSQQVSHDIDLQKALEAIDFVFEEVMKIKNHPLEENRRKEFSDSVSLAIPAPNETESMVVGFDDDFMAIKNRIYGLSSNFEVIPIVGMGGIGKSTLARKLYRESAKMSYFDRRAWIVVSQEYSRRELLLEFLQSLTKDADKQYEKCDSELMVSIHKEQFGRRCLIVVDDLWTTQAWDDLNTMLPKQSNGSRVLVTTRLLDVATCAGSSSSPPHEMHFLNEKPSWELLEQRVFGKGSSCPSDLEETGKLIAKNCHGLPLTLVVVSGLLKGNCRKEYWESVSQNISSREPSIAEECSKVMSLSFDCLPVHLKPCFLYVTAFPEDSEINANRLIRLWMAEGFVEPNGSQHLEEVAEGYLEDLAGRSLVLISRKRYNGKIKAIRIHDLLRDFGIRKSQELSFHSGDLAALLSQEDRSMRRKQCRLCIQTHESLHHLDSECCRSGPVSKSLFRSAQSANENTLRLTARSLLIFLNGHAPPPHILDCTMLRVLEAPHCRTLKFDLETSLHLRYAALHYNLNYNENPANRVRFSKYWFKFQSLQTLILYHNYIIDVPRGLVYVNRNPQRHWRNRYAETNSGE